MEGSENGHKYFQWPSPFFSITGCDAGFIAIEFGRYWHWVDFFSIFFAIAWIYAQTIFLNNLVREFGRIPFSAYFFIVIPGLWPPIAVIWDIISLFCSRWRVRLYPHELLFEKKRLNAWKVKARCKKESLREVTFRRVFGGEYKIKIEADSRISIANIASRESADWLTRLITSWKHAAFEDASELVRNYRVSS